MPKEIDSRVAFSLELIQETRHINVERVEIVDDEEVTTYVVMVRLTYWFLDSEGNRMAKAPTQNHDLFPRSTPITSPQYANNMASLAPLVKAAMIEDRENLCGPD